MPQKQGGRVHTNILEIQQSCGFSYRKLSLSAAHNGLVAGSSSAAKIARLWMHLPVSMLNFVRCGQRSRLDRDCAFAFRDQLVPIHHRTKKTACRHSALERLHSAAGSLHCGCDVSNDPTHQSAPANSATPFFTFWRAKAQRNRLKNRFNFVLSNGDFLQVLEFNGTPEEIRTPDP
jgi:hypothetical protein